MNDSTSGLSSLPSFAFVLSLEYEADEDGRAVPLEERLNALRAEPLRGQSFAAYTDCEDPERTVYLVAPMRSTEEEQCGELPRDQRTQETLQTSGEGLRLGAGFIAEHIPEFSNLPGGGRLEPAPYVQLISAVVKPGLSEDLRSTAWEAGRKIAAAHRQNRRGGHFAVYHSYRGPDEVVYVAVPLDRPEGAFDRLDYRGLLQEAYGADEAARLTHVINRSITGSVSSVGKRHPSC